MIEAKKYSAKGEEKGSIQLPETLFDVTCKKPDAVLYEVIKMYQANQRQGTSCKKSRGEVQGSTRKIYKQKKTGNARMGNNRTPIRKNGGRAFPPKPKDWYCKIPIKKKRLALKIALSMKAKDMCVMVIEDINMEKPNTKYALEMLTKMIPNAGKKLLVIHDSNQNIIKSFANIPDVRMDRADGLYAYEILNCKYFIITEEALKRAQEVFVK
jgi:large subunit ribosomal protein L4